MAHLAVPALAHAALHVALEAHVDAIVGDILLAHLLHDEPVHHRRPTQGPEGVRRIDLQMLEGLGDKSYFPVPPLIGVVHGQVQLEVAAVLPHLELVAEHDLGRVFGTVDDGDLPELAALVVDVVDERAQRRDAEAAGHQKHVVAAHLIDGEAAAEGPADADDLAALHLVQPLGEAPRAPDAQLDEAAFCGRRGDGDGRLPHAEDGQLHELARLLAEGLADALVHEAELEELLGGRKLGDGGDARRPRAVGVRVHELGAGGLASGVVEGMHGHDVVVRHGALRPLSVEELQHLDGADVHFAGGNAAAAAHAEVAVVLGQKAVELVVHAVPHARCRRGPEVVAAGHHGELRRGAGVPHPLAAARGRARIQRVADIEAVAGGADIRAGVAGKAAAAQLLPEGVLVEGVHEHGNLLDVGDVPVEGLLAGAGGGAKRDAVLVGGFADIAGRL